jgi:hypothetical protein
MNNLGFRIIRLYRDAFFLKQYERNRPFKEVMQSWDAYISKNRWFFEHYFSTQTKKENLENRVRNVCERADIIRRMAAYLENNIKNYAKTALKVFGSPSDIFFNVIPFVGLRASDGWVDFLKGRLSLCIALEYYDNVSSFELLIVHVLCHVIPAAIYMKKHPKRTVAKFKALERAVSEGIAIYASKLILPSITDSFACFYHEEEYKWCLNHKDQLVRAFVQEIDDADAVKKYFHPSYRGTFPPRTGYFIGKVLIEHLTRQKSLLNIVLTPSDEIINDIKTMFV